MVILFDFDHTLFNWNAASAAMARALWRACGIPRATFIATKKAVERDGPYNVHAHARKIAERSLIRHRRIRQVVDAVCRRMPQYCYPDVLPFLHMARQHATLALLSKGDAENQLFFIKRCGIAAFFKRICIVRSMEEKAEVACRYAARDEMIFINDDPVETRRVARRANIRLLVMKRKGAKQFPHAAFEGFCHARTLPAFYSRYLSMTQRARGGGIVSQGEICYKSMDSRDIMKSKKNNNTKRKNPKSAAPRPLRVVVIGGGTGTFTVLSGLKRYVHVWPTAIVTMADDGGSSGVLRSSLGSLPGGDIRRALVALSEEETQATMLQLFTYRFPGSAVEGHSVGNLLLAALEKIYEHEGGFERAVDEVARILRVRGSVVPVTLKDVRLHARYEDGTEAHGETNIDIPKQNAEKRIERVWLDPAGSLNPRAREAIYQADLIVIGPGDLYTSVIPNLIVDGMTQALKNARAPKAYVVNVMTKLGETHGYLVHDFIEDAERYIGRGILTHVVYNTTEPLKTTLDPYHKEGADLVRCDRSRLPKTISRYLPGDYLDEGELIRHHPVKLAEALLKIL